MAFCDLFQWIGFSQGQWALLCLAAVLTGMSKTGIQGGMLLIIPLLAMAFGARESTGIILPMLCMADIFAVCRFRRIAEWRLVLRLLPSALAGFMLAILIDSRIPSSGFRILMGVCLLVALAVMLVSDLLGKERLVSGSPWSAVLFGVLGGFTTMIGNAAGPVMAVYLLSMRMSKMEFVGTNAWFFLVVNLLKVPLQGFVWHNLSWPWLTADLIMLPLIILGGVIGLRLVRILPEKAFRVFITSVTWLAVILMLI